MNVLESLLILAATLSALWWAFARHRAPVALERLSLAGLGLGGDARSVAPRGSPAGPPGPPVPDSEPRGGRPAYVAPYPAWFYGDFDQVDTRASASPPASAERPTWPVLVFLPGWGSPREDYSA